LNGWFEQDCMNAILPVFCPTSQTAS
jgi:hypothetical protein